MKKVVLITGTSKGIGKIIAEYYLKRNCFVTGCSRGKTAIKHENYVHHSLDVSDEKAVLNMVHDVKKRQGKLEILINNAGIASMNHMLLTPLKSVQNVFATNVFGTFLLMREAAKIMMRQKYGRIVNFSTVAVPLMLEGEAVYAASKSAVETLTKIIAKELGAYGITVNAVGPAPILTDLIKSVPKKNIDSLLSKQAIKRLAEFEDIINAVDFFIDKKSSFITGQVVYLGGANG